MKSLFLILWMFFSTSTMAQIGASLNANYGYCDGCKRPHRGSDKLALFYISIQSKLNYSQLPKEVVIHLHGDKPVKTWNFPWTDNGSSTQLHPDSNAIIGLGEDGLLRFSAFGLRLDEGGIREGQKYSIEIEIHPESPEGKVEQQGTVITALAPSPEKRTFWNPFSGKELDFYFLPKDLTELLPQGWITKVPEKFISVLATHHVPSCTHCGGESHQVRPTKETQIYFSAKHRLPVGVIPTQATLTISRVNSQETTTRSRNFKPETYQRLDDGTLVMSQSPPSILEPDGTFSELALQFTLKKSEITLLGGLKYRVEHALHNAEGLISKVETIVIPNESNDNKSLIDPFTGKASALTELLKVPDFVAPIVNRVNGFTSESEALLMTRWQNASGPRSIYVIVPVYREFWSENLGAFLISMANQNLSPLGSSVNIVFNVNNTSNVEPEIRLENQETVAFLRELQARRIPNVRPDSSILRKAIFSVLASQIQIHVLDNTTPGYTTRNIGMARDEAFQYVLKRIPKEDRARILIAQMDADSRVPPNFLSELHAAYLDPTLRYSLSSLVFGTERGSNLKTYRRMIAAQVRFAGFTFYNAVEGKNPLSGSPRIVATAEAVARVGGVPHRTAGEDTVLVRELREAFPSSGRWLYQIAVETSFRGRVDGYDASHYLTQMDNPVEMGEHEKELLRRLEQIEVKNDREPLLAEFRQKRLIQLLSDREQEVLARRALLRLNIQEIKREDRITTTDNRVDLGLFTSPEFESYLRETIEAKNGNPEAVVKAISANFPHLLNVSAPPESRLLARLQAATDALLSRHTILNKRHTMQNLPDVDPACLNAMLLAAGI